MPRTSILARVYPITAEDEAQVVANSGGPAYQPTPGFFIPCRDSKGFLISILPEDVVQIEVG